MQYVFDRCHIISLSVHTLTFTIPIIYNNYTPLAMLIHSSHDIHSAMFEQGHMQYELDKDETKEPRLVDLVEKALKILKKDDDGFFLLIECMYCYDQSCVPTYLLPLFFCIM